MRRIFLRAFVLICFSCISAPAQDDYCLHRTVPIVVLDGNGTPISNLAPSDFAGSFRKKAITISSLGSPREKPRVLILIDASGSMRSQEDAEFQTAIYVADQLVATNLPNASFAVYIFGEKAGERLDFAEGNDRVLSRLREILKDSAYIKDRVKGQTPLLDAIADAIRMFGNTQSGDTIAVISDGIDSDSKVKAVRVRTSLLLERIRLFACVFPNDLPPGAVLSGAKLDPRGLAQLALDSGGVALEPFPSRRFPEFKQFLNGHPDATVLAALTVLDREVVAGENLEFTLPRPVITTEQWQLALSKDRSNLLKGAQILYPRVLLPCSEEVAVQGKARASR